jgi:hypothetical protein
VWLSEWSEQVSEVVGRTETSDESESSMKRDAVFLAVVAWVGVPGLHGVGESNVLAGEPPADKHDVAWVGKRVEAWQPTKEERAFHEIGWVKDLREAQGLGKKHNRPVFLFTYDGASLSGYRC